MKKRENMVLQAVSETNKMTDNLVKLLQYGMDDEGLVYPAEAMKNYTCLCLLIETMQTEGILPYVSDENREKIIEQFMKQCSEQESESRKIGRIE